MRKLGWTTVLAMAAFAAVLLVASPASTAPGDVADLAVSKGDAPDPVVAGATLTYSIGVVNNGPQAATRVTIRDRLPSHTALLAVSGAACKASGRNVVCEVAALAPGASVAVSIQVRPTKPGTIANTVRVSSAETDPIGLNDRATASTRVIAPSHCRGVAATIVGTPGRDRLVGTDGRDVIAGLRGNDTIYGRGGRDLICAGGGDDWVNAGPHADRVFGGKGADRLLGRGGPDLLAGNPGADVLKGNRGTDRLRGGPGFDRCFGGVGRDSFRACERRR
jgi:uncharacterized repeat protein (TIGR01451 family)